MTTYQDAEGNEVSLDKLTRTEPEWAANVIRLLTVQRDEARAHARVLAHAYRTDNRPPTSVVENALGYPVLPGKEEEP